jgi:hypothetical protein
MICAKMQPAVSGLEKEFPGKVKALNVDATTPEAVAAVKELGFRNHGLVIRDASGKAVWKQPDHQVNIDDVRAALKELTSKS